LFDGLNEAITPAFRDDYEPCLETSCQVETLSCFDDAACVAKLHIMAGGTTKGAGGRSRRDPFMGGGFMFDDDFFEGNDDFLRPGSYFTMCNRGLECAVLPVDWADTKVVNGETFCCSAGTATITSKNILGFAMDECVCDGNSASAGGGGFDISNYDNSNYGNGYGNGNGNGNGKGKIYDNDDDDADDAVNGFPVMTAEQEWKFGLESLESTFDAESSERALVTCMLRAKCGMASALVVAPSSTTAPGTEGSTDYDAPSIWTWLSIIIVFVVLLVALVIVLVTKKSRRQTNGGAHRIDPSTLTVQNAAYQNAAYEESAVQTAVYNETPGAASVPLVHDTSVLPAANVGGSNDEFEC